MATYKVIQDIEAEDKLLGPLTLRQFIYAGITVALIFIDYKLAAISLFAIIPLLLPIVLFGALAIPFGRDQPNEIWLLARVRFFLKPRRRIWKQGGYQELVTITAPKVIQRQVTKDFTPTEAKSRLKALASTIDTRGWAVKNVGVNLFNQPGVNSDDSESDRLIDPGSLPQDVPSYDVSLENDLLDSANPTFQHLSQAIQANEEQQRQYHQTLVEHPEKKIPQSKPKETPADYWFMHQPKETAKPKPGYETFNTSRVVYPGEEDEDLDRPTDNYISPALEDRIKKAHKGPNPAYGHTHILQPLPKRGSKPKKQPPIKTFKSPKTSSLAADNDKSIATLAHEAKQLPLKEEPPEEVVVSLH